MRLRILQISVVALQLTVPLAADPIQVVSAGPPPTPTLPLLLAAALPIAADPIQPLRPTAGLSSTAAPRTTQAWLEKARKATVPAQRISYLENALATFRERQSGGAEIEAVSAVAAWHLDELLAARLPSEALEAFAGLPPAVRERLKNGTPLAPMVVGVAIKAPRTDLRIGLAAAAFLAGDEPQARALLALVPTSILAPQELDSAAPETDRSLVDP